MEKTPKSSKATLVILIVILVVLLISLIWVNYNTSHPAVYVSPEGLNK